MPLPRRSLTPARTAELCALAFAPTEELIGVEVEWPVRVDEDPRARLSTLHMNALSQTVMPAGSALTFEPGGQVEVSTRPFPSAGEALAALDADEHAVASALASQGLTMTTAAVDESRRPQRVLSKARYAAMEEFFDAQGPSGRWMMCNTTSMQVNLSHDPADPRGRWETLHLVAPVLIAAFANSPGIGLDGRHWASVRQGIWWSIDPGRTRPVAIGCDPAESWLEYVLAADVMYVDLDGSRGQSGVAVAPGTSFGQWMTNGHELGWPTAEDLQYHMSTLFPPVRPRGWNELRVLDALLPWIREVATIVVAVCGTAYVRDELRRCLVATDDLWIAAARHGLRHPRLASAARELFAVVCANASAAGIDADQLNRLETFRVAYVDAGRMPGDDLREVDLRSAAQMPAHV